ncbi:MAG: SRPBCC family protein [Chloroflexi bacterium]|nr:SRPBCC family protein [Chloroflexota bacterium]
MPVPIGTVYEAINDVGGIGYCIAGAKEVKVLNDSESEWKLEVRAGVVAQVIKVHGWITERRFPEYLGFAGEGQHLSLAGHVGLTPLGADQTRCEVAVQAEVVGPLAPIINLVAKTTQRQLVAQSIANFRVKMGGLSTVPQPVTT